MSGTSGFLLIFIIVGTIYFPDIFSWIWLTLGIGFFLFIIVFHTYEGIQNRKFKKRKAKEG